MKEWLRKMWMPVLIIIAGLLIFGDTAQLAVTIYTLSAITLVLLLTDFILDNRKDWGIFPTLDLDAAITEAQKTPLSAAILVAAMAGLLIAIMLLAVPSAHGAAVDQAKPYLPMLSRSLDDHWPTAPLRHIPAGQIEQESAWKERATLKTTRELGRGLVQMTIAYDSQGRERFNIYRDAVRAKALKDWDWRSDPYNPRYQLVFLTLQDRANFSQVRPYFADDTEAWKGALVCYNAGAGRWLQRRANAKRMGLPSDRWDGGLDKAYGKGEAVKLYGRPLWQAVNEYPTVIFRRADKYRGMV